MPSIVGTKVDRDTPGEHGDLLSWSWVGGALAAADLGDPTTTSGYTMCVLEDVAGTPAFQVGGPLPRAGWTRTPSSVRLQVHGESGSPVAQATLRAGPAGKIKLKAKGEYLEPHLPLGTPVTVRLVRDEAPVCWEATFAGGVSRNDAGKFVAKSD